MSEKLGYTFYPKDWQTSDAVFELNLAERGFYRELIDLAMLNDNSTEIKIDVWSRKYNVSIEELETIINKLIELKLVLLKSDKFYIPSCEKRINIKTRNANNGAKGGAPKGNANALKTTQIQPKNNPNSTKIESEVVPIYITQPKSFLVNDLIIKNFLAKSQFIHLWAKSANKSFEEAKSLLNSFLEDKKTLEIAYKDIEDLKSHITNWFRNGNLEAKNQEKNESPAKIPYKNPYEKNAL